MKLAILYSLKYSPEEAAAKYLVPYNLLLGYIKNNDIINSLLTPDAKYNLIIELTLSGYSLSEISEILSWKEFEDIVSNILKEFGYDVRRNIYIRKPKREIDIIGVKGSIALVIDCKNWRTKITESRVYEIVSKHIERAEAAKVKLPFLRDKIIIPLIITLYPYREIKVNSVFIISIDKLKDFLLNIMAEVV